MAAKKDTWGHGMLKLLFKEVMRNMPAAQADNLANNYRDGRNIVLIIGPSAYGKDKQTAFATALTDDQSWRGQEPVDKAVERILESLLS